VVLIYFLSKGMGCGSSAESAVGSPAQAPNTQPAAQPKKAATSTPVEIDKPVTPPAAAAVEPQPPLGDITWKQVHSAVRWNKPIDTIRRMLDVEGMVNSHDTGNGNTPLHIASQNGHIDLVKVLIEKGGDVNLVNKKNNTPLHMALSYDYIEVSEYLLKSGADGNILNDLGFPARRGLEGDKCLAAVYLAAASSTTEALKALTLCSQQLSDLDKATFAGTGLKTKKNIGDEWTDEVNEKFKDILNRM
jgi:hypothetical protein